MKRLGLLVLSLSLIAYSLAAKIVRGTVVSVHDGDSLTLQTTDNRRIKIRLYGIDAPELKQPFGQEAREALATLVLSREVLADIKTHDRYGRSIALVTMELVNVNERQIVSGMSWWYRTYAKSNTRLSSLSEIARKAKVGLWSQSNHESPWSYLKELTESKTILGK